MTIQARHILIEPETINVGGRMPYAIHNTKHVQNNETLAFAYRKSSDKRDTMIRVVLESTGHRGAKELSILLIQELDPNGDLSGPTILKPQTFQFVGHLGFSLNSGYETFLEDEYYKNNSLTEGQTYAYKKYSITLLDKAETDMLSQCTLMLKYGGGSGLGLRY